jgi:peptidoglycan endopeptidase LytF
LPPSSTTQTQLVQTLLVQSNRTPNPPTGSPRPPSHPLTAHTYVVQSRDTLASISRKYNVKLDSLALANPAVDARKLRVGQTLNIP